MNNHKSTIQAVLEHEATKVISIIVVVFSLIKMVVLPIQEIQLRLTQIQIDVLDLKGLKMTVEKNTTDIEILRERINNLIGR